MRIKIRLHNTDEPSVEVESRACGVDGLRVHRDWKNGAPGKTWALTHVVSGFLVLGGFAARDKAVKAGWHLGEFDWTRDAETIQADDAVKEAVKVIRREFAR